MSFIICALHYISKSKHISVTYIDTFYKTHATGVNVLCWKPCDDTDYRYVGFEYRPTTDCPD
jgi:hypothetical protein